MSVVAQKIAADTVPGAVHLTVSDLARARAFYEHSLGLSALASPAGTAQLGVGADGEPLLVLTEGATAPLDHRVPGLYHFALLVPTRRALAAALVRLASTSWPLAGASDHLVSEALYLTDPDGIGIEIYRDRPRDDWPGDGTGQVEMATLPLDLGDLLGALTDHPIDQDRDRTVPPGTTIGHVHLQVDDLRRAESFYAGVLGFEVTQRGYPGALFLSAGGYHHHIGLNVWHSRGGQRATAGAVGLRAYELRLADAVALEQVVARVREAGLPILAAGDFGLGAPGERGALVHDPSGNALLLRT